MEIFILVTEKLASNNLKLFGRLYNLDQEVSYMVACMICTN